MNETNDTVIEEYRKNVRSLFADIENWSSKRGLSVNRETLEISEEEFGSYQIEKLFLTDAEHHIAKFVPIGRSILGAEGRVDMVGLFDREVITYMKEGGPYITQSEELEGQLVRTRKKYFYRGINETGWYWVESTRLGRAKKFDEALFSDLLGSVSGYEAA